MNPPMIAKLPKLFLIVLMIPFLLWNAVTELKGHELNAPHSRHREAPITRERQAARRWARA
jgi:hypothetical protein